MKIIIDTTRKTISLEDSTNLGHFFEEIKKLLPNNYWKEFELITGITYLYYHNYPWVTYYNTTPVTINPGTTGIYYLNENNVTI